MADAVRTLREDGADVPVQTNLHEAVSVGNTKRVRELLKDGVDVNEENGHGQTPLHTAVHNKPDGYVRLPDISVCQTLISYGSDVNQQDTNGNTPLHLLCRVHNDTRIYKDLSLQPASSYEDVYSTLVSLLVANGADVNIQNKRGKPALSGWFRNLDGNDRIARNAPEPGHCFKYLALLLVLALMVCPVLLRILFPHDRLRLI